MPIIRVENVSKDFAKRTGSRVLLSAKGIRSIFGASKQTFRALDDVSFEIEPGECIGLIGANGSGKSTLLKLIAGVTAPTTGRVRVEGRVASLLELGAGFHPLLTGRENIYLNAGLYGMRHAQVDEVVERIIDFSGVREFIDQPVNTYSSGMYVRVAFAVAVHVNPDVFLVDEVLAVGDESFQRQCRQRIGELRAQGKTILFVSHDLGIVNSLCERVLLLHQGALLERGAPQKTIEYYLRLIGEQQGIHRLTYGEAEVLFSNGALSLYHKGEPITTPSGCNLTLHSMRQPHGSNDALWKIESHTPTSFRAVGQMKRLPIRQIWNCVLDDNGLRWEIEIECQRDLSIECVNAICHLPTAYDTWHFGALHGRFPDILPTDTDTAAMAAMEAKVRNAAAFPHSDADLPIFKATLLDAMPAFRLNWSNSTYLEQCRLLESTALLPLQNAAFGTGTHKLVALQIQFLHSTEEAVQALATERTVHAGSLAARFDLGRLCLAHEGRELSTRLHLYTSMRVQHLWHDSIDLQWNEPEQRDGALLITGYSRRFPLRQHWRISPEAEAIALEIDLEILKTLEIQEYHTSLMLHTDYDRWQSDHESGVFQTNEDTGGMWRHRNKTYAPGTTLIALSPSLPSVRLEVTDDARAYRMTPVDTGMQHAARVLQALRNDDQGSLVFEPGFHTYFKGRIIAGS